MLKQQQQQRDHQQQRGLHESVHVFGKPWFWQRNSSSSSSSISSSSISSSSISSSSISSSMDSTRSLAQVIMEMRDEIKKLEEENRELRGDSGHWSVEVRTGESGLGSSSSSSSSSSAAAEQQNVEENHSVNLRRNVSAPVLDGQYKEPKICSVDQVHVYADDSVIYSFTADETSVMTVRRYSVGSNLSDNLNLSEGRSDRMRRSDPGWRRLQEEMHHGNDVFANPGRGDTGKVNNRHSMQEYVHKNRVKVKTVTFLLPVDDIYTNRPVLSSKHQGEPAFTQLTSIDETDS